MKAHTRHIVTVTLVLAVLAAGLGAFVWSGVYNIGADDPHYKPTTMLLTQLRERSIDARSRNLQIPRLDDPARIRQGAANYNSMCAGCHLAPGGEATEISQGLYPAPPGLDQLAKLGPAHAFWVAKHGLKMSGMPAWGVTMYDAALWDIVAAFPAMSSMTPAQYEAMIAGVEESGQKNPEPGPDGASPDTGAMNTGAPSADMRDMRGMKGMDGMKDMKGMKGMNGMDGMKDMQGMDGMKGMENMQKAPLDDRSTPPPPSPDKEQNTPL